jgi:hypothetical protein
VVEGNERGERFARDIASMRISDPSPGRHDLWLRVGFALMAVGFAVSAFGYWKSQSAGEALVQRDAITLGLAGIASTIFGAALYLRYSVSKVLRFWLARLSFDLSAIAEQSATVVSAPTPPPERVNSTRPQPVRPIPAPSGEPATPPQAERLGGLA